MIALEIAGLVDVRGGAGTFVVARARPEAGLRAAVADPGPGPFDVIGARQMLEGEIAFAAAGKATPARLRGLSEAIEQMRADIEAGRDTRPSDRLFHGRVAEVTGTAVLSGLVDGLWAHMLAPMFDVLGRHAGLRGKDRMTVADHERIVEALARRDPEAAREAMRVHLAHVEEILMLEDLEEAETPSETCRSEGTDLAGLLSHITPAKAGAHIQRPVSMDPAFAGVTTETGC